MGNCCKVGKAINRFNLKHDVVGGNINQYMISRWEGRNGYPEMGVRPLTEWFNKKIVKSAYKDGGRETISSRIESDYEILNGDDEDAKQDIINDLSRDGIDGEEIANSFISASTLVRHFNNCLETKKPQASADKESKWEENKIEFVQHSMKKNTKEALKSLDKKGRIVGAAEAEVSIPVILECSECSTTSRFDRALERGYICKEHADLDQLNQTSEADKNNAQESGAEEESGIATS